MMNCDCPKVVDEYGRVHLTYCPLWKPYWVRRAQHARNERGLVAVADKTTR